MSADVPYSYKHGHAFLKVNKLIEVLTGMVGAQNISLLFWNELQVS
jgi:hypothetical protein